VVPIEVPPSPQKAPFEKPVFEKQISGNKLEKHLGEKSGKPTFEKPAFEKQTSGNKLEKHLGEKSEKPTFEKPAFEKQSSGNKFEKPSFEKQGSRTLELPSKRASVTYERGSSGALRGIRTSRSFERLQRESSNAELNPKYVFSSSPLSHSHSHSHSRYRITPCRTTALPPFPDNDSIGTLPTNL
jgi:hypothetical protein